jgi:hypothetical protein
VNSRRWARYPTISSPREEDYLPASEDSAIVVRQSKSLSGFVAGSTEGEIKRDLVGCLT